MDFSRAKLIEMIEACYDLVEHGYEADSSGLAADLKTYFKNLADALFEAGAFSSIKEARRAITIYESDRQIHLGPDGVVPDDGSLNPDQEADGILALFEIKEYLFQVPIAELVGNPGPEIVMNRDNVAARIASFSTLDDLGGMRAAYGPLKNLSSPERWIWVAGSIKGRNYRHIQAQVQELLIELQGAMLVLDLANYRRTAFYAPPPMTIGRGSTYNIGAYFRSTALRMAPQLAYAPLWPFGDLDPRRAATLEKEIETYSERFLCHPGRRKGDSASLRNVPSVVRQLEQWREGHVACRDT
jgi:hypothetical protein